MNSMKSSAADEGEGRFVGAENKTMNSRNLVNQDYRLLRKKLSLFNLNHIETVCISEKQKNICV